MSEDDVEEVFNEVKERVAREHAKLVQDLKERVEKAQSETLDKITS